jgi:hypothetical protein
MAPPPFPCKTAALALNHRTPIQNRCSIVRLLIERGVLAQNRVHSCARRAAFPGWPRNFKTATLRDPAR